MSWPPLDAIALAGAYAWLHARTDSERRSVAVSCRLDPPRQLAIERLHENLLHWDRQDPETLLAGLDLHPDEKAIRLLARTALPVSEDSPLGAYSTIAQHRLVEQLRVLLNVPTPSKCRANYNPFAGLTHRKGPPGEPWYSGSSEGLAKGRETQRQRRKETPPMNLTNTPPRTQFQVSDITFAAMYCVCEDLGLDPDEQVDTPSRRAIAQRVGKSEQSVYAFLADYRKGRRPTPESTESTSEESSNGAAPPETEPPVFAYDTDNARLQAEVERLTQQNAKLMSDLVDLARRQLESDDRIDIAEATLRQVADILGFARRWRG